MSGAGRALPFAALFGLLGAVVYVAQLWVAQGVAWAWLGLPVAVALAVGVAAGGRRAPRASGAVALGIGIAAVALATVAPATSLNDHLAKLALALGQIPLLLVGYDAVREPLQRRRAFRELGTDLLVAPVRESPVPNVSEVPAAAAVSPVERERRPEPEPAGTLPGRPEPGLAVAGPTPPTAWDDSERGEATPPVPPEPAQRGVTPVPGADAAPVPTPLLGRRLANRQREATAKLRQAIREAMEQEDSSPRPPSQD